MCLTVKGKPFGARLVRHLEKNIKLYFKSSLFFSFKMIFTTIKKIIYTRYMKAYLHVTSLYASFQFLYFPLSCILKDGLGERTRLNVFSLGPCLFPDELTSFCAEDFSACRYAVHIDSTVAGLFTPYKQEDGASLRVTGIR